MFNQQTLPKIILLKGDTSQGRGQLISNINACLPIQHTVRTTLGPLGPDKLMVEGRERDVVRSIDKALEFCEYLPQFPKCLDGQRQIHSIRQCAGCSDDLCAKELDEMVYRADIKMSPGR